MKSSVFIKLHKTSQISFMKRHSYFFFLQTAPVQQNFDLEIQTLFEGHNMRIEKMHDDQIAYAMFEVINLVDCKDINDKHGKEKTSKLLDNKDVETELKDHGLYKMKNARGAATHALNMNGMKALIQYLTSPFAMKFKKHYIEQGTRVDAGDQSIKDLVDANAASSNIFNQAARHQIRYQAASAGPSIAAPPDQVLERACLLFLYLR